MVRLIWWNNFGPVACKPTQTREKATFARS